MGNGRRPGPAQAAGWVFALWGGALSPLGAFLDQAGLFHGCFLPLRFHCRRGSLHAVAQDQGEGAESAPAESAPAEVEGFRLSQVSTAP